MSVSQLSHKRAHSPPRRQHCLSITRRSLVQEGSSWYPKLFYTAASREPTGSSPVPPRPTRKAVRRTRWTGVPSSTPALRHPLSVAFKRPVSPQYATRHRRLAAAIQLKAARTGPEGQGEDSRPAATQHPDLADRSSEFTNPARPAESAWHPRHPPHTKTHDPPADPSRTPKIGEPRQSPLTLSSLLPFCHLLSGACSCPPPLCCSESQKGGSSTRARTYAYGGGARHRRDL